MLAVPGSGRAAGGRPGGARRRRRSRQVATDDDPVPERLGQRRRWDVDERGIGVADARAWRAHVDGLRELVGQTGWVAEEPELHLLPHLEAATAEGPLTIRRSTTGADGTLVVELEWVGSAEPGRRAIREALFRLVGLIAETRTLIHEPPEAQGRQLDVVTGSRDGDGVFAGHGHTVRLRVLVDGARSGPTGTGE